MGDTSTYHERLLDVAKYVTTRELAGQMGAAGYDVIAVRRLPDKPSHHRLCKESPDADQDHAADSARCSDSNSCNPLWSRASKR